MSNSFASVTLAEEGGEIVATLGEITARGPSVSAALLALADQIAPPPADTGWYVIVDLVGDVEGTRETAARALEYAATQIRRPGYGGGRYGNEDEGFDLEVLQVDLTADGDDEEDTDEDDEEDTYSVN